MNRIARGITVAAFFISSAMCTAESACKHGPNKANEKRVSVCISTPGIDKDDKYLSRVAMRRKKRQWDRDRQETDNVENKNKTFEFGQRSASNGVDEYCKG